MRVSQVYSHYHYNVHSRDKELQVLIFRRLSQEFKQFEKTGRNNKKLFLPHISVIWGVFLYFSELQSPHLRDLVIHIFF